MTTALLSIRGLAKRYGPVRALGGIDLTVREGTIYGFLGPNGAGKTTTIRIVAGLVRPLEGTVHLDGRDLLADRPAVAASMRTLVENPAFYPHLTGSENLALHARLVGAGADDVDRLLAAVALDEARDRTVGGYSLGMRQRLGIAQALVGRPRLVVLDEPMNGLDPAGMREMRLLIRRERDEHGTTFLLSSHLLHDVGQLADEVGILHRGAMVAEGRLEELLAQSPSGFRIATTDDEAAVRALRRHLPDLPVGREEVGLHLTCDEAGLAAACRVLLDAGAVPHTVTPAGRSLERYFLDKTEGVIG